MATISPWSTHQRRWARGLGPCRGPHRSLSGRTKRLGVGSSCALVGDRSASNPPPQSEHLGRHPKIKCFSSQTFLCTLCHIRLTYLAKSEKSCFFANFLAGKGFGAAPQGRTRILETLWIDRTVRGGPTLPRFPLGPNAFVLVNHQSWCHPPTGAGVTILSSSPSQKKAKKGEAHLDDF